ncbi:MAG: outer rane adhesin like protein [Gemmataceae bacterium]|nr:outer rane adhesin like protein [Gemmataceae bacterium]
MAALNLGYSAEWVALLPDGRFLAAGSFQAKAAVAQVLAEGHGLDSTFGTNGVAQLNFGTGGVSSAGVALDNHGRIVYGADVYNFIGGNSTPAEFAVGRLTVAGVPDATFGTGGTAVLDVSGVGASDVVLTVAVQPDDRIVLGGWTDLSTGRDSALARFNADGTPDSTFGTGGTFHQSLVTTYSADTIFSIAPQSDGRLVALTGWAADIRAARFNTGIQTITLTASGTVSVLDPTTNQPPVAANQAVTTAENTALTGTVTATDAEGDPLTYAAVARPQHGPLTLNPNGTFTYTPGTNYYGSDSVTFKANDGLADSNVATVSITVTHVNQPPVAAPASVTATEDHPATGQLVATDPDSPTLSYAVVAAPQHGSVRVDPGTGRYTYTPATGYAGPDGFTFKANDGQLDSNVAAVDVTVTPETDPPVAADDAYSTAENTPLVVGLPSGQGTNSLTMVSAPGDYIGQGHTYSFGPGSGTYSMYNPYPSNPAYTNAVTVSFSNATEWWYLDFEAPNDAPLVSGTTYTGRTGRSRTHRPRTTSGRTASRSRRMTGNWTRTWRP